jgi:hypothetical protein
MADSEEVIRLPFMVVLVVVVLEEEAILGLVVLEGEVLVEVEPVDLGRNSVLNC